MEKKISSNVIYNSKLETLNKDITNPKHLLVIEEKSNEITSISPQNEQNSLIQVKYRNDASPNRGILNRRITPALPSPIYIENMLKYQYEIKKSLDTHKYSGFNQHEINKNIQIQANSLKLLYSHLTEKYKKKKNVFTKNKRASIS